MNDSQYGLTTAIFTKDKERLFKIAPRVLELVIHDFLAQSWYSLWK
jgi:hypothetical protein